MSLVVFTPGQVLTAQDLNDNFDFVAGGGLTLIKSQTILTAATSVVVDDVFSADYDVYKITISGGTSSSTANMRLQLGATTTGYMSGALFINTTAPSTPASGGDNNAALFTRIGSTRTGGHQVCIDLLNPFLAKETSFQGGYNLGGGNAIGLSFGLLQDTTSYTGFTISPSSGNITGGIIRVYGYRN